MVGASAGHFLGCKGQFYAVNRLLFGEQRALFSKQRLMFVEQSALYALQRLMFVLQRASFNEQRASFLNLCYAMKKLTATVMMLCKQLCVVYTRLFVVGQLCNPTIEKAQIANGENQRVGGFDFGRGCVY